MSDEFLSRARHGEAFWRAHHEAWRRSEWAWRREVRSLAPARHKFTVFCGTIAAP